MPPVDPSLIEKAPLKIGSQGGTPSEKELAYLAMIGEMSARLEAAEVELQRKEAKKTIDDVRAAMMEPYANRVFCFVVIYCIVVGAMLTADGYRYYGFHLSDVVLGIIAGSTAVSVIGLIGIVVSGLFGKKSD